MIPRDVTVSWHRLLATGVEKKKRERKKIVQPNWKTDKPAVCPNTLLDRYKFVKVTKEDKEMNRTKINFEGSDVMLFWMEIHSVRCVMKIPYSEITLRIANVSQEVCDK